jgi:hypothetical protein
MFLGLSGRFCSVEDTKSNDLVWLEKIITMPHLTLILKTPFTPYLSRTLALKSIVKFLSKHFTV